MLPKGFLLDVLQRVERHLPELLRDDARWTSLDVAYEPPRVERLWCPFEDGAFRIYLHRIHPCERALFHPHPWPSAIKILSGVYEMGIGYSPSEDDPPEVATVLLTAGSSYEMIHPDGWHYVRPLGSPSLSLMVTGVPWETHAGTKRPAPGVVLQPLSAVARTELLGAFRRLF